LVATDADRPLAIEEEHRDASPTAAVPSQREVKDAAA
jgi:hypothetical protein